MTCASPIHTGTPGEYLKDVREKLGLTLRDVEEASARVATDERRTEFFLSASHLNRIEMDTHMPSLPKLFTICAIYGCDMNDILRRYGMDGGRIRQYSERFLRDITRPVAEIYSSQEKIPIPIRMDPSFRWELTNLINRCVAIWGEIPASFLINCNPRRHTYGFVGLADTTMQPLIRPGSFLMIDTHRRKIVERSYANEADRPIYFIELRDGYRCAWCQIRGSKLLVIPHMTSGSPIREFNLPTDAEIVGQVVGVAMRLVPATSATVERVLTAPAQSAVAK